MMATLLATMTALVAIALWAAWSMEKDMEGY